jgi:hydroxymethylglutaryl-CoA lyase
VGGCPYAAGAAGNAATQDLVYLFHQSGVPTGVDIDRLAEAASLLEGALGRDLPGRVHRWQVARRSAGRAARRA